jgi:hypothetical protein
VTADRGPGSAVQTIHASSWLVALVRDFTDPDPCSFDHHGYCQAHSWLTEGECPHARAKRFLALMDDETTDHIGSSSDTPDSTDQGQ